MFANIISWARFLMLKHVYRASSQKAHPTLDTSPLCLALSNNNIGNKWVFMESTVLFRAYPLTSHWSGSQIPKKHEEHVICRWEWMRNEHLILNKTLFYTPSMNGHAFIGQLIPLPYHSYTWMFSFCFSNRPKLITFEGRWAKCITIWMFFLHVLLTYDNHTYDNQLNGIS
jgi:hypothetical protein